MKHYRESRQLLLAFVKNIKAKLWLSTRFEFESAVTGSDCNCKRITAGSAYKFLNLFRTRIRRVLRRNIYVILYASQSAELCFNYNSILESILDNLLVNLYVLLKMLRRSINHNRSKTAVYARLTSLKIRTVIEVQSNRDVRAIQNCCLNQLHQVGVAGISARAL